MEHTSLMLELSKHNSDDTAIVNDDVSWNYGERYASHKTF